MYTPPLYSLTPVYSCTGSPFPVDNRRVQYTRSIRETAAAPCGVGELEIKYSKLSRNTRTSSPYHRPASFLLIASASHGHVHGIIQHYYYPASGIVQGGRCTSVPLGAPKNNIGRLSTCRAERRRCHSSMTETLAAESNPSSEILRSPPPFFFSLTLEHSHRTARWALTALAPVRAYNSMALCHSIARCVCVLC